MNIVLDTRPSSELSDLEVCAYLIKAIRSQGLRTGRQVRAAYKRMFPDMPKERRGPHFRQLAEMLS